MILPDVNVLVHAFRSDSGDHRLCRRWLDGVVNGDARYGMAPQVLASVLRVTTHPRIFAQPSDLAEATEFCELLLDQPHCEPIRPGGRHWQIFSSLLAEVEARGNLVADAWFAALAIEAGCEWITLDRDYERFPGLRSRPPAAD